MTFNYMKNQLERLGPEKSEYPVKLKITNDNGATNWLNITEKQLEQVKTILLKG